MTPNKYDSPYARTAVRGKAREALQEPKTFAIWGKHQITKVAAIATWPAQQWFSSFLQEITGTRWIITATTLDLAVRPRHDPLLRMVPHEETTDDPPLLLPLWVIDVIDNRVSGTAVIRFIEETLSPSSDLLRSSDKPYVWQVN
jgi:hypothetical protein